MQQKMSSYKRLVAIGSPKNMNVDGWEIIWCQVKFSKRPVSENLTWNSPMPRWKSVLNFPSLKRQSYHFSSASPNTFNHLAAPLGRLTRCKGDIKEGVLPTKVLCLEHQVQRSGCRGRCGTHLLQGEIQN